MLFKIIHKLKVIKNLDWDWLWKFFKKRIRIYGPYYFSKIIGRKYWEADIDGTKVKLYWSYPYHHLYARALAKGQHERILLSMWKKRTEEANVIFDIGGYNGIYGLVAAAANPKAEVVIYEMDPINISHIKRNIEMNGFKNITLIPKALSAHGGIVFIKEHRGATSGHIANDGTKMESTTIKEWINENRKIPDLLKFDIYGMEYEILMTEKDILSKSSIFLEFYPTPKEQKFWQFLKELGYHAVYLYPRADGGAVYYYVFKEQ